jgi:outer membrane lipoprotein-sorting protein
VARTWLRWLPALTVPAVIAAGVLAGSVPASAGDPLPSKSPEQVLQLIAQHRVTAFSGTLEQSSSLGLPVLPQTGPGAAPGDTAWLELLTGPHTARVYRDGADKARVQVLDRLAERDVVRHGNDVWFYNSKDNTAAHAVLPSGAGDHRPSGQASVAAPDALAEKLLAKLDPSSDVSVGADVEVAGRAAYQLVLTPKSSSTLLASAVISVDGQNGMPLGVELKARGQAASAYRVAFSKLSLEAPDAGIFQFSPPAGATVKEIPVPDHKPSGTRERTPAKDGQHKVSGTGWESVVELPAAAFAKQPAGRSDQQPGQHSGQFGESGNAAELLAQATVPVAGGRLLSSALLNVLILDDGRVFAGSVPLERLQAAAAGH